jgi:chloramphenicol 3-O phosphotransferase
VIPGTILILNGASSSGKSSLVAALQRILDEPFLEAGMDKFIFMLPKRYLDRPLWDDILGSAVEAGSFGHQLFAGMHRAIAVLSRCGLNVIADHVLVEPAWVEDCARVFAKLPAYLIGVRCPLEVLVAREAARKDRTLGQAAAQHDLVHRHGVYDLEVDSSLHTTEYLAAQIRRFLLSGDPPSAFQELAARLPVEVR